MRIEWKARWSGGMKEAAVLIREGSAHTQSDFARHVEHVPGGYEKYRAEVERDDYVVLLYQSGSGKTQSATSLFGWAYQKSWDSWSALADNVGVDIEQIKSAFLS